MKKREILGAVASVVLLILFCCTFLANYVELTSSKTVTITYDELVKRKNSANEAEETDEVAENIAEYSATSVSSETQTTIIEQDNPVLIEETKETTDENSSYLLKEEQTTAVKSTAQTTAETVAESTTVTTAQTASVTEANSPTEIDEKSVTVYVSASGKYHSKSNCSGMKKYTEMSLDEAIAAGHTACKKCW